MYIGDIHERGKYRNWENKRNYVYLYVYLHKNSESEVVIECYLCCVCNFPVIWWHCKCWSPVDINKLLPSSWRILMVQSILALLFLCVFYTKEWHKRMEEWNKWMVMIFERERKSGKKMNFIPEELLVGLIQNQFLPLSYLR